MEGLPPAGKGGKSKIAATAEASTGSRSSGLETGSPLLGLALVSARGARQALARAWAVGCTAPADGNGSGVILDQRGQLRPGGNQDA